MTLTALKALIPGSDSPLVLRADLARGARAVVAFLGAGFVARLLDAPPEFAFAAIAAQDTTFFDVRGAYRLRLAILACAVIILTATATLGAATADSLGLTLLATAVVAPAMGLWRHLNPDNGPQLAITSMLLFLLAHQMTAVSSAETIASAAWWTFGGAAWGAVVQVIPWFFRPQQPLRASVAECWIAVAELFEAGITDASSAGRQQHAMGKEAALRTALDKTYASLASGKTRRSRAFVEKLDRVARLSARLAMRVGAVQTAIETAPARAGQASLTAAFHPILVSLANNARAVALAVVSRRPAHIALVDVRLKRIQNLIAGFTASLEASHAAEIHLVQLGGLVAGTVSETRDALHATIDRAAERAAFSLELTDTDTWSLRPLGAALNFGKRFEPVLVRFMIRLTILAMIGVVIAHALGLAHSYWLPLTAVVVLQPDYGSTRDRAFYRTAGTLFGAVIAVGLLHLNPPAGMIFPVMTACLFAFAFFLRRSPAYSATFVTLFVVLLTGFNETATSAIAWERLGANSLGAVLALAGAFAFWPVWETRRFPTILAAAIRANLHYWRQISLRKTGGGTFDSALVQAKQRIEAANAAVFASLMRLTADPEKHRPHLEQAAAVANDNQRLTRAFSAVALRLPDITPPAPDDPFLGYVAATLEAVADTVEGRASDPAILSARRHELTAVAPPPEHTVAASAGLSRQTVLAGQRGAIVTELLGLIVAAEEGRSLGLFPRQLEDAPLPSAERIS